ncbi:hypothetical protein SRB5_32710 [Streptomyces sp. RB5]|uniref:Uncharacterized protein n=1 Tax=Streptomyces smaragdinus TaxID=2585196 RepID=A0A7K0CI16_9ACTN|nr:hypothetical protein [Streptomyces smaragdinus]MQY13130.1 hypothetical protein [Streptomyces smaragdinus]
MTETATIAPAPEPEPAPPAEPAAPAPCAGRRRVLRAVARWTCAVLAFAGAAAGTAHYVTGKERADLPGLATEDDGRWDFPPVRLPALPASRPGPFAGSNPAHIHHADLRTLLLPAPKGAEAVKGLPGRGGWLSLTDFTKLYDEDDRADLAGPLREAGLRHIAATGWTMPDGTRTRIYLLRFGGEPAATDAANSLYGLSDPLPGDARLAQTDKTWTEDGVRDKVAREVFDEEAPVGDVHLRFAALRAGDVVGLVVQETEGVSEAVPFHQTVILQSRLLD